METPQKLTHLPEDGLLRWREFAHFLPVKKSSWWEGVRKGVYPAPVRLGTRTVAWRAQDLRRLLDYGVESVKRS